MNRFAFIFKTTFQGLIKKRMFNLIIIIALSIGLFLPMLFLAKGNYKLNFFRNPILNQAETIAFVDGMTKHRPTEKLDNMIGTIKGVTDFAYYGTAAASIEKGDVAFLSNVAGISEKYFEMTSCKLLEGRLPTPEEIKSNARVCVARQSNADFTDGWIMKPGDKFILNGIEYTLIGIVIDVKCYGLYMVPYGALEEMVRPNVPLQYMMFMRTAPDNIKYVLDYINALEIFNPLLQSRSGSEYEAEVKYQHWVAAREDLVKSIVLLTLSVLNFILIIYGKFVEMLYTWGIKTAVGATKGAVFAELFLQNLIFMLVSSIAPTVIISKVLPQIMVVNMLTNGVWMLAAAAMCIALALVVSAVLYIALMHKNIPDMLKIK